MKRRLTLVTTVLVGLVLLGLLAGLTYNRLTQTDRVWFESLTRQGAFILGTMEASSRAGMRMMHRQAPLQRLQFLAEEMTRVGLVVSVFILDKEGRILVHSNPGLVGKVAADAGEYWAKAKPGWAGFEGDSFEVGRQFHPVRGFRHMMSWRPPPDPGPRLGVVRLPLVEYQTARQAEVRQAVGLGATIFVGGLAVVVVVLLFHDRRMLNRLKKTTGHLIDQMPAGLLSADSEGRIITANLTARRMLGLADDEAPAGRLKDFLKSEICDQILALEADRVLKERPTELILEERSAPVSLSVVRLEPTPEDPTALIVLMRDLRQVKELEERLKRSERLAALGRLSAGVAHEIRNPLSSIRGLAQYLRRRLDPDSEEAGLAEVMIGEADRLNRVVNDLLAYARPRPPRFEPGDLGAIARRVVELTETQAQERGVELSLDIDGELGPVELDADQITQVIFNLVLNAIESGARRVRVTARRGNGSVVLTVGDDGPGVDEKDRSHIFDPFYTTKAKGSGLGLSISLRIVEEHGGSLTLIDDGPGAVFELELPLSQKTAMTPGEVNG